MTEDSRINQFRQMADADPENELGHFSLGKACLDAGRPAEAIEPLSRAIALNARLSKAYQLLGVAYERSGRREEAVDLVTRGVTVADEQGDRVPRDAMVKLLADWGAPSPELKQAAGSAEAATASASASAAGGAFSCVRCGAPGDRLEKSPFKGPLGQKIFEHVCKPCWREWIGMGTKVINELGLVLSTQQGQETYDQYMIEFLQLDNR